MWDTDKLAGLCTILEEAIYLKIKVENWLWGEKSHEILLKKRVKKIFFYSKMKEKEKMAGCKNQSNDLGHQV